MAGPNDTFDVAAINAMAASAEAMTASLGSAQGTMSTLMGSMQGFVEMRERMTETPFIDQESISRLQDLGELMKDIQDLGHGNIDARQRELTIINKMLSGMERMAALERHRVRSGNDEVRRKKEGIQLGERDEKDQKKKKNLAKEITGEMANQTKQITQSVARSAGLQMSLIGILALIVEAANTTRKINAYGKQIAGHWKDSKTSVSAGKAEIRSLRKEFRLTYEEAAAYNKVLAQIGFEKESLKKINKELVALEQVQGISVKESGGHVANLMNNFGLTAESAMNTYFAARDMSKEMGGSVLSMDEVVNDWMELGNLTKVYNTDLQTTLGFYNTLVRKDIAEKLGLGKVPVDLRRNLAKTVVGFSQDLSDGMKAALGTFGEEGMSMTEGILNFEAMSVEQQFKKAVGWMEEKTKELTGADKQIAVRQLLKTNLSFDSAELRKVFAEAFSGGAFSGEKMDRVMNEIAKQRQEAAEAVKNGPTIQKGILETGKEVSRGLQTLQELLSKWFKDLLLSSKGVQVAVEALIKAIPVILRSIENLINGKSISTVFKELGMPAGSGLEGLKKSKEEIDEMIGNALLEKLGVIENTADRSARLDRSNKKYLDTALNRKDLSRVLMQHSLAVEETAEALGPTGKNLTQPSMVAAGRAISGLGPKRLPALIQAISDKNESKIKEIIQDYDNAIKETNKSSKFIRRSNTYIISRGVN